MNTRTNEKALAGGIREGFESKLNLTLDGKFKGFDVFNNTENVEKLQCLKCNPPLVKARGAAKLCPGCQTEIEQTTEVYFDNFKKHHRVYKLDQHCFGCNARKTATMMSKIFPGVCRRCADKLKEIGATARNNFINRAVNNFFKGLKKAVQI